MIRLHITNTALKKKEISKNQKFKRNQFERDVIMTFVCKKI